MRTSFRLKIALYTAAISAVPLLVAGWLLIDVNEREVESATQSLQLGLVGQVADLTDAELRRVEGSLRVIADTLANPEVPREARLDTALRLVDAAPELRAQFLAAHAGDYATSVGVSRVGPLTGPDAEAHASEDKARR